MANDAWQDPGSGAFFDWFERFKGEGLDPDFAYDMATLVWWGLGYGIEGPRITSGRRSRAEQEDLRERWRRGEPGIFKPAVNSKHLSGLAVDLGLDSALDVYSHWAPIVNVRWAGPGDPVHFERA